MKAIKLLTDEFISLKELEFFDNYLEGRISLARESICEDVMRNEDVVDSCLRLRFQRKLLKSIEGGNVLGAEELRELECIASYHLDDGYNLGYERITKTQMRTLMIKLKEAQA